MHTAFLLKEEHFGVEIDGRPATRDAVFPSWRDHDRLGVVIHEPLGAIGSSMLVQLAITAFYDCKPERRDVPIYPELYFFHVGRRFGNHGYYDLYPPRREVVTPGDPAFVLEAVNERAITRLLVVDQPVRPTLHHHKEPSTAYDRIVSAYAYSSSGRVLDPTLTIQGKHRSTVANTSIILRPDTSYAEQMRIRAQTTAARGSTRPAAVPEDEIILTTDYLADDVSQAVRDRIQRRRAELDVDGFPAETYRQVSVEDAIRML